MRDNVEAESPEDYFRKSINVPFLCCTLTLIIWNTMWIPVIKKRSRYFKDIYSGADPETVDAEAQLWSNIFNNWWNQL
jgi:hypothetical protein